MPKKRVKVAVIGAGYFGSLHAQKLAGMREVDLVAVCDHHPEKAEAAASGSHALAVTDYRRVFGLADAAVLAIPTLQHFDVAKPCLEAGLDLLVEKPICESLAETDALIRIAKRRRRILQVGHLERFSPVIEALIAQARNPKYIESQRTSPFRGRGSDTTVMLDMLIHDLDHTMRLAGAPIASIDAVGAPVLTEQEDIASARIRFANGCVATIGASRIGGKISRRLRVFQPDRYLIADMAEHKLTVLHPVKAGNGVLPSLVGEDRHFPQSDLLLLQARDFVEAVRTRRKPRVSAQDIRPVMAAALQITDIMRSWRSAWK
jgi:predicted dehydrogenase